MLQRVAADPVTVSGLVCLDDALESADCNQIQGTPLRRVQRAMRKMLYTDGSGVLLIFHGWAWYNEDCDEDGLPGVRTTILEKKMELMRRWSVPTSTETALHVQLAGQRYMRTTDSIYSTLVASTWTRMVALKVSPASSLREHSSETTTISHPSSDLVPSYRSNPGRSEQR